MFKICSILFLFCCITFSSYAQLKTYTFQEVEKLSKENPKPIVVFIHTSWCKYCQMMENGTLKNKAVINKLNSAFYFIYFNAESKKDINYNNYTYKFIPSGNNIGIHELAIQLATVNKTIVHPTLTIIDKNNSILYQNQSFLDAKSLLTILDVAL